MFRYPVISVIGSNKGILMSTYGHLPFDRKDDEVRHDFEYTLYVCNSTELGMPRSFREEKFFRLTKTQSDFQEIILDEGKVVDEKIHTGPIIWRRRVRLQGKKIQDFFIDVPEQMPLPQSAFNTGFKSVIDQIAARRR